MKHIDVGGETFIVDDAIYPSLASRQWFLITSPSGNLYARDTQLRKMHREVVNYYGPLDVDHVDGDGRNNQLSNLRIVTRNVNNLNRANVKIKSYMNSDGRVMYIARICLDKVWTHLGLFRTERRARIVYEYNKRRAMEGLPVICIKRSNGKHQPPRRVLGPALKAFVNYEPSPNVS